MRAEGAGAAAGAALLRQYGAFFKRQLRELAAAGPGRGAGAGPVRAARGAREAAPLLQLAASDNTLLTKMLAVFATLCREAAELRREAGERHYPFLAAYNEYESVESGGAGDTEAICQLAAFVHRCQDVLKNICSQLFQLYKTSLIDLDGIQLHFIISHASDLAVVLVVLDLLITASSLPRHWAVYCKNIQLLVHDPDRCDYTEDRLKALTNAAEEIHTKIMSDNIFQDAINNLLMLRQDLAEKKCSIIATEFNQYLRLAISNLDKATNDNLDVKLLHKCIKVNVLFVLNTHLFGTNDKKCFKALVDLNIKAHSVPLHGTSMWFPEQFLQRYLPSLCSGYGKLPQTLLKARQSYLSNRRNSIARDELSLQLMCTQWILTVEDVFSEGDVQLNASQISRQAQLLLKGLQISSELNYIVTSIVNLHLLQGQPLPKSVLMSIFRILAMLKGLRDAILRNEMVIVNCVNMIVQHLVYQSVTLILSVKKNLMIDKNYANQRLDELTSIVVAEKAMKGAVTLERNIVANVALSFLPQSSYPEDSYTRLAMLLEKIDTISNVTSSIENLCNGSWLFWHKDIIPIYLAQNFAMKSEALQLKYMLRMLEDCGVMLHKMDKLFNGRGYEKFVNDIKQYLDECVVKSASQQIETNLRLHIHSHLQLDTVNPFVTDTIKRSLIVIDNFKLLQDYVSVVPSVEHYLSTMYYNLTTVVLSDWKTYGEMRQMAKFKFNLQTVKDNLPTQTLEQGLDVLEIMRNIHIFVSKYLYNLNNQIFIEKSSNNKHLNSINITHIANSIRTHGTGIMNTTVNFTYQFLRKKFYTFSQFMYDEHIKSRLIKDLRNFRESSANGGSMYNYKNADRFNKGIRNLGIADDGQSYLDLFRDLITQIGNAMGYVRMIRSGGRHCCANATVFLPAIDRTFTFKELCERDELSSLTVESGENLDHNIDNLISNFTQGTEYFQLLVDVFAPVFRNPKNVHLKNFFMIVPPLTINFVENLILAKDKMTKKNKVGAAFTDDGFAMGVAYILKLLNQDADMDALHWFPSVWSHIANERKSLEEQKAKGSVQLQQALALTEKKLSVLEQEFKLLYYSFSSSRIFFQ